MGDVGDVGAQISRQKNSSFPPETVGPLVGH